jgi:hypothetical protein
LQDLLRLLVARLVWDNACEPVVRERAATLNQRVEQGDGFGMRAVVVAGLDKRFQTIKREFCAHGYGR